MTRLSFSRCETLTAQKTPCSYGTEHRVSYFDFTQPALRRFFCLHVDLAGKLGEFFVGGFFLVQSLLQQADKI